MQSVYEPSPGLRAVGEVARALAALGRAADGLALTVLARLGALWVGLPLLRRRYVQPLHRRSRALRGATVRLHRISPARDPRAPRDRVRQPLSFHWIEITVRPPRRHRAPPWRPEDLALVAAGARPRCPERDEAVGRVHAVTRWRNGYWLERGPSPDLVGPQRLRLLVGVAPGTRHFRFRYYLELLRREPRRGASGAPPRLTRRAAPHYRGVSATRRWAGPREGDLMRPRTGGVARSLAAISFGVIVAAAGLLTASGAFAVSLLNPGFETGDFTDWLDFNTASGSSFSGRNVTSFDVDGDGGSSFAVEFQVGSLSGGLAGAGVSQDFTQPVTGLLNFQVDVAASGGPNGSGGLFQLLLDDVVIDSHDFGFIDGVERATLSASLSVAAGVREVKVLALREFFAGPGTPRQYIDDVVLTPEPGTLLLTLPALAGLAVVRRRARAPVRIPRRR